MLNLETKGGTTSSEMRAAVRSTILPVSLTILLAFLLSFTIATYIYYPWPEKLAIYSSLARVRHYMWSVNFIRNPWKLLGLTPDNYLVFHALEEGLMLLANCYDAPLLNRVLLPVGLLSMLALAQLANSVTGSTASRNIALILPFIFSGLGWLYLLLNRPASPAAYFTALVSGSEKVYGARALAAPRTRGLPRTWRARRTARMRTFTAFVYRPVVI